MHSPQLPLFLRLPQELRDLIYTAIFKESHPTSGNLPPEHTRTTFCKVFPYDKYQKPINPNDPTIEFSENEISYPLGPVRYPFQSLLLVNHQISAEIKNFLNSNRQVFKLYLIIHKERTIYPTWIFCPQASPSNYIDKVETSVYISGSYRWIEERQESGWESGNRGYGFLVRAHLALINRFLERGPDFLSSTKKDGVRIGELLLNVISGEEPKEGWLPIHITGRGGYAGGTMHPETLANILTRCIGFVSLNLFI